MRIGFSAVRRIEKSDELQYPTVVGRMIGVSVLLKRLEAIAAFE